MGAERCRSKFLRTTAARLSDSRGVKREIGEAIDEAAGFYSVYSVKRRFGASAVFSVVRSCQNASPWPHLFSIFKCIPSSQAGRRGFDPRLPLRSSG